MYVIKVRINHYKQLSKKIKIFYRPSRIKELNNYKKSFYFVL